MDRKRRILTAVNHRLVVFQKFGFKTKPVKPFNGAPSQKMRADFQVNAIPRQCAEVKTLIRSRAKGQVQVQSLAKGMDQSLAAAFKGK